MGPYHLSSNQLGKDGEISKHIIHCVYFSCFFVFSYVSILIFCVAPIVNGLVVAGLAFQMK